MIRTFGAIYLLSLGKTALLDFRIKKLEIYPHHVEPQLTHLSS